MALTSPGTPGWAVFFFNAPRQMKTMGSIFPTVYEHTAVFLSGILFAITVIGIWAKTWWEKKQHNSAKDIHDVVRIMDIMDHVIRETPAQRFLILKTENGGGRPLLGKKLYASVLYERNVEPFNNVMEDYQRLLVDEDYIRMLNTMHREGQIYENVREMPESLLRRIYIAEGVKSSWVFFLKAGRTAFYYCSIATSSDEGFRTAKTIHEIEIGVNKIRNIFKKLD